MQIAAAIPLKLQLIVISALLHHMASGPELAEQTQYAAGGRDHGILHSGVTEVATGKLC